jgi:hypothetical protein
MGNKVYVVWTKDGVHPWCESVWDSKEKAIAEAQRREESARWDPYWVTETPLNSTNMDGSVKVWDSESEENSG